MEPGSFFPGPGQPKGYHKMKTRGLLIESSERVKNIGTVTTLVHDGCALGDNGMNWDEEDEEMFDAIIAELRIRDEWHAQGSMLDALQKALGIPFDHAAPASDWMGTRMEKYVRYADKGRNIGK